MQWALWDNLLVLVLLTLCCAVLRPELCAALGTPCDFTDNLFWLVGVFTHHVGKRKGKKEPLEEVCVQISGCLKIISSVWSPVYPVTCII